MERDRETETDRQTETQRDIEYRDKETHTQSDRGR